MGPDGGDDMDDAGLLYHARQIMVPRIGLEGQKKLTDSTVLLVGAGGLGCSVAQYLAGSGVGRIVIVDHDVVESSNIARQVLFDNGDIGLSKAAVLAKKIRHRCPETEVFAYSARYSHELGEDVLKRFSIDVVIDAGDDLVLSYALDALALSCDLPIVFVSVSRVEGYSYTRLAQPRFLSFRALFPASGDVQSCSQSGVLTTAVGLMAAFQAHQVLRVLLLPELGDIEPEIHTFDGVTMTFSRISLPK